MPSLKEISNMNNDNAINAVNNLLITGTSSSVSYYPKLERILHRIGRNDYNKCAHAIITVLNCTVNPNDKRNNYIPASSLANLIENSISKTSKYIKTGDDWATIIINDYDSFVIDILRPPSEAEDVNNNIILSIYFTSKKIIIHNMIS